MDLDMDYVKHRIEKMRQRTIIIYAVIIVLMLGLVMGVVGYYELRLRSVVGNLYLKDEELAKMFVNSLFDSKITEQSVDMSVVAVKNAGYTENGFEYLFSMSGQWIIVLIVVIVALGFAMFVVKEYMNIGKSDIFSIMVKITKENVALKEQLSTSVAYVDKRNRQLQDFIENVAHQVKTPLTALSMALDMGGAKEDCFFHVERIKEFIQRLMKISRMESGKIIFAKEDIVVSEMLNDVVRASGIDSGMINVVCDKDDYYINGDRGWLKECFINIIANSLEYIKGKEDGRIVVNADCREEKCIITISDNGPGFSRKDIDGIFDRFESSQDANSFHVGIGLNLAKLIVEAHHGTIQASNAYEHQGAQFRIIVPRYTLKRGKV